MSMDKFYELVFGEPKVFFLLCQALPRILDDVIAELHAGQITNSVLSELRALSTDTLHSLFLLAFGSYTGFSPTSQS